MSTYRRQGHYRRGPNGQQVWVSSHIVTRSSGRSYAPTPPTSATTYTAPAARVRAPRVSLPQSLRWAKPNATCPVCRAAVYFYANEFGSRVYFDEVGPPWPKHPCTNTDTLKGRPKSHFGFSETPVIYKTVAGRAKLAEARNADRQAKWHPQATPAVAATLEAFIVRAQLLDVGGHNSSPSAAI